MKLISTIVILALSLPMALVAREPLSGNVRAAGAIEARPQVSAAGVAQSMMPRVGDFTSMWWAEGFPGVVKGAPWLRCIRTGHYAFYLNTETLKVEHMAAVTGSPSYGIYHPETEQKPVVYAPADLMLKATVDGKVYYCRKGAEWSRWHGPRVIAAGRFMQRADVTNLEFVSAAGESLEVEARFETVAWADRLSLILAVKPKKPWQSMNLELEISNRKGTLGSVAECKPKAGEEAAQWQQVALVLDPVTMQARDEKPRVIVSASERSTEKKRRVVFDAALDCYRVDIDNVAPELPIVGDFSRNDAIERVRVMLENPTDEEQLTRLLFEKTKTGISQNIGSPITGISAILRDKDGMPTGIPVQLSKNWHNKPEGGVYTNAWFHGITQLRLPPQSDLELELTVSYGHWGGVPAASHAQLSLIGWGSNQLWEQSAIGAWGESLCYEPSQAQANCTITDVRPLMVAEPGDPKGHWKWTNNVGGGDFFRLFDAEGVRIPHKSMQAVRHKLGPCLTEVSYGGKVHPGMWHSATVGLSRSDDIVRGTMRLHMRVYEPIDFSRFVIFQAGADTYNYTAEKKLAMGNETGLIREWDAKWGGDTYRTEPMECVGRIPWVALSEAEKRGHILPGPWANRGLIVRSWKARLGGKETAPWVAERGTNLRDMEFSTLDFVPPPGVSRLEPGDYVEATIEYVVHPQTADQYYGPNRQLKSALQKLGNSWKMVMREAVSRHTRATVEQGQVLQYSPDLVVETAAGNAKLSLHGGMGYMPVTFSNLPSYDKAKLLVNGKPLDQSVHGNDFWQTDYHPSTKTWSRTYNIPTRKKPTEHTTHIQLIHP